MTCPLSICLVLCWFLKHSCKNESVLTSGSLNPFSTLLLPPPISPSNKHTQPLCFPFSAAWNYSSPYIYLPISHFFLVTHFLCALKEENILYRYLFLYFFVPCTNLFFSFTNLNEPRSLPSFPFYSNISRFFPFCVLYLVAFHHFGLDWNISATIHRSEIFSTDVQGSQGMTEVISRHLIQGHWWIKVLIKVYWLGVLQFFTFAFEPRSNWPKLII